MKQLIMMVGLPRSGKTTRALGISKNLSAPIVSSDAIRLALHGERYLPAAEPFVWTLAKYMVSALFEAGHDIVILDSTNITIERRGEWKSLDWVRSFEFVSTPAQTCIDRARATNDLKIIPVIKRYARMLEEPCPDEWSDWEKPEGLLHTCKHTVSEVESELNLNEEGNLPCR